MTYSVQRLMVILLWISLQLENEIIDVPQADEKGSINSSYDFNWEIAYEKLLKIASSIKRDE